MDQQPNSISMYSVLDKKMPSEEELERQKLEFKKFLLILRANHGDKYDFSVDDYENIIFVGHALCRTP